MSPGDAIAVLMLLLGISAIGWFIWKLAGCISIPKRNRRVRLPEPSPACRRIFDDQRSGNF